MEKYKYHTAILAFLLFIFSSCRNVNTDYSGKIELEHNWLVQPSEKVNLPGSAISGLSVDTLNWLKADVPSTIMGVLIFNKVYSNLFFGDNLKKINTVQFDHAWWYRKTFRLNKVENGQHVYLHFDGISYSANIWLNGKLIASRDSIFGAFRTFQFDITHELNDSLNVLAIEVFKKQPGDFGIGFVDWNPEPPDESMGLWRDVYLKVTGSVAINHVFVHSKVNTKTLDEAWLSIKTELVNYSSKPVTGYLKGRIGKIEFKYPVDIKAGEKKMITLSSGDVPALHIQHPRLWWCNNLGKPNLYGLTLQFVSSRSITDKSDVTFGIRQIDAYYTDKGYKGFKLNGKKVLIRGAGWVDDLFLQDNYSTDETQIRYVKHMNLNTIRLEGFWGNSQDLFDLCDKYGILVMVGWSCQWEWDGYLGKSCDEYGGIKTDKDINLAVESLDDQVRWLQNHPGVFVWMVGSDKLPRPSLEAKYKVLLESIDDRPYLAAANGLVSGISGPTGVKMTGPYEYEGPNYWYIDSLNGGAFGFNTETGPGPQIPEPESLKKMIPENKRWPVNKIWNYHCTSAEEAFNSLDVFNKALDSRYGKPTNLNNYLLKSDVMEYEAMKAMYESYRANIPNTTGIIQWMLNSAWPSLYWQLYDYYLLPTSAYYATRKANEPLQLIYNYGNNSVSIVNESPNDRNKLKATLQLYTINSQAILSKEILVDVQTNSSKKIMDLPDVKGVEFLRLRLLNEKDQLVSDNFYWLSQKQDEYAWNKTFWAYTPMKSYADFKELSNMPSSNLECSTSVETKNDSTWIKVILKNESNSIAFFIRLNLQDENNKTIFPVFWDDNLFSMTPGEILTVRCFLDKETFQDKKLTLELSGWNIVNQNIQVIQ